MRLAAARWRMLALVGAVRLWRAEGSRRRWLHTVARRWCSEHECTRALYRWKASGAAAHRRRAIAEAAAVFWMAQSGGRAIARWRAAAGGTRDAVSTAAVATTAEQRAHRATLRAAVGRWRTRSAQLASLRTATRRWRSASCAACLVTWRESSVTVATLRRAASQWVHGELARGFASWLRWRARAAASYELLHYATSRWLRALLVAAFRSWQQRATTARNLARRVGRSGPLRNRPVVRGPAVCVLAQVLAVARLRALASRCGSCFASTGWRLIVGCRMGSVAVPACSAAA